MIINTLRKQTYMENEQKPIIQKTFEAGHTSTKSNTKFAFNINVPREIS